MINWTELAGLPLHLLLIAALVGVWRALNLERAAHIKTHERVSDLLVDLIQAAEGVRR